MNAKRDALKKKLAGEIDSRRSKLNEIFQQERIELSKSVVGKCFKEYHDTGDNYTRYTCIVSANEFGSLKGFYFDVYDDRTAFSRKDVFVQDADRLIKYAKEINRKEFDSKFQSEAEKINS